MFYAIEKTAILICLHTRLDAVQGKGHEGGKDARGAGGDFGSVALGEGLGRSLSGFGGSIRLR